jgi:hypothetical protein
MALNAKKRSGTGDGDGEGLQGRGRLLSVKRLLEVTDIPTGNV